MLDFLARRNFLAHGGFASYEVLAANASIFFCILWLLRSGLLGVSRGPYFHTAELIYFLPNLVMSSLIAIVGKREGQGFL
jgi:hypothetical protein